MVSPRGTREYNVIGGYDSAKERLTAMVKDGELVCWPSLTDQSRPNLYALKGHPKPINDDRLYGHEMDCADCFVSARLAVSDKLIRWERLRDLSKPLKKAYLKYDYRPDRIFEHQDINEIFHLEVDRGTEEDLEKYIAHKCETFIRMSEAFDSENMTMLFTARGYRYDKEDNDRANKLYKIVSRYNRGNQILISLFDKFLKDPFGPIWVNAKGLHVSLHP